jgi:uncharacterized protein
MASLEEGVISPLVEVEFYSLLALKVRTKDLDRDAATAALGQFNLHIAEGRYRLISVGIPEYSLARDWLSGFETSLISLDALHLAAAFSNGQTLLTTDKKFAEAAKQLRVPCNLIRD